MAGAYVPLVLVPRYTSYIGAGEYVTAPLDVTEFSRFVVAVWRGLLVGDPVTGAGLSISFEWSDDADADGWFGFFGHTPITTPNGDTVVTADLSHRYLRMKITLTEDTQDVVAITIWAAGHLERREGA